MCYVKYVIIAVEENKQRVEICERVKILNKVVTEDLSDKVN